MLSDLLVTVGARKSRLGLKLEAGPGVEAEEGWKVAPGKQLAPPSRGDDVTPPLPFALKRLSPFGCCRELKGPVPPLLRHGAHLFCAHAKMSPAHLYRLERLSLTAFILRTLPAITIQQDHRGHLPHE